MTSAVAAAVFDRALGLVQDLPAEELRVDVFEAFADACACARANPHGLTQGRVGPDGTIILSPLLILCPDTPPRACLVCVRAARLS